MQTFVVLFIENQTDSNVLQFESLVSLFLLITRSNIMYILNKLLILFVGLIANILLVATSLHYMHC
jgi:hypothetical protein